MDSVCIRIMKLLIILSILFPLSALAAPWKDTNPFVISYITNLAIEYQVNPHTALALVWCESRMKMGAVGTLSRVGKDRGGLQVNDFYHGKRAKEMGFDLTRSEDSLEYGMWLFAEQGFRPWLSSRKCWQKFL